MAIVQAPGAEELQQLASLLTDSPQPATDKIAGWSDDELLQTLDYHGIALLAHAQNRLPAELSQQLNQRKAMMAANELLKIKALAELFAAFQSAGLEQIILFKGSALAHSCYSRPWLRPRSDTDCLIDESQIDQFTSVFNELGYQKLFAIDGEHIHYQSTFSIALAGQAALNIDLHWHISNRKILARAFNVDELLAHSHSIPDLSPHAKIPCPIDSILISAVHRLGHHPKEERLVWLYDIHLLSNSLAASDWQTLTERAISKKIAAVTLDVLKISHRVFKTEIPAEVFNQLDMASDNKESSQLFLNRELNEWQYFWHDLKGLDGLGAKLQVIWESLFPSPSYVRQRMNTRSTMLAYLRRMIQGVRRITRN